MNQNRKKFIKVPHLEGGRELLKEFLHQNLVYPKQALEKDIEGDVIVRYKVSGKGEVIESEVIKSIGYGCDEEALRLVNMLRYQQVNNRGLNVVANQRIKIPFRLPKASKPLVQMVYQPKQKAQQPEETQKKVYTYTIGIPEKNH